MFGKKNNASHSPVIGVAILCKFWKEDDVWNACAEHLPVAVFGDTFEEARSNLSDAIISHFESLRETGRVNEVVSLLLERARDYLTVNEIAPDSPLVKMLVSLKDQEVDPLCV